MDLLHGGGSFVNSAARCGRGGNNKRGGGNSRGRDNGRGNGRPPQHNDSTGDHPTCQLWQGGPHGSTLLQTLRRLLHWAAGE
jgi:hypothetical protein